MAPSIITNALVAVHNYPTPCSCVVNLQSTAAVSVNLLRNQQIAVNIASADPFPLNLWKRIIRVITAQSFVRNISETLSLSESTVPIKVTRKLTETLALSENTLHLLKVIRNKTDTLSLAEAATIKRKITRSITDTLTLTENLLHLLKVIRNKTDTLTLSENTLHLLTVIRNKIDTLTLSESVTRIAHHFRTISDTLTLSENLLHLLKVIRPVSDTLHFSENTLHLLKVIRNVTETLHLTENTLHLLKVIRKITDTLTLSETVSVRKVLIRLINETLTFTEGAAGVPIKVTRKITETLALAESIKRKITRVIPMFQLYDNFESGTYTYSAEPQASPNNLWTCQFRGGGTAGVQAGGGTDTTLVEFQTPQVATNSGQSFSALVTSNSNYTDFILEFDVRTIAQIRTGSAPNNWEVAWVFWHWTDNNHQYYFTPKMSGVELGKKDTGGTQIILDTPGTAFTNTLGTWYHVKIISIGNHFKTYVNGTLYNDYTDIGVGGFPSASNFPPTSQLYSGKVGLYCEDSQVQFDNVSITPLESVFFGETLPQAVRAIRHITDGLTLNESSVPVKVTRKITETLTLAESTIKRKITRVVTDTLHLTESVARFLGFHRIINETLTFTESPIVRKISRVVTETLHFNEAIQVIKNGNIVGAVTTDVYRVMALFNKNIRTLRDLFFGSPGNTG